MQVVALCTRRLETMEQPLSEVQCITQDYHELLRQVDAVYIRSLPEDHYAQIKTALDCGKHVLCESPVTLCAKQTKELFDYAPPVPALRCITEPKEPTGTASANGGPLRFCRFFSFWALNIQIAELFPVSRKKMKNTLNLRR